MPGGPTESVKKMTGPVEEVGKVANSFIDSLKSEPLSLALVFMNIVLLGFFWFILSTLSSQRQREIDMLYADHREVRDLLARCIVPGKVELSPLDLRSGKYKVQSEETIPVPREDPRENEAPRP